MNVELICVGSELLSGDVVSTNASFISKKLRELGHESFRQFTVDDNKYRLSEIINDSLKRCDVLILTGGLGPTRDDMTKKALAKISGASGWRTDREQERLIISMLDRRGIAHTPDNLAQALVPDSCEVILNRLGTAPVLPGVPHEAVGALPDIMDDIRRHFSLSDIYHRTLVTFGIPESIMSDMLSGWESSLPEDMKLAYLPDQAIGLRLRLSIYGGRHDEEERRIRREFGKLEPIIGDAAYGWENDTLESVIGNMLKEAGMTVSAAESCTGGRISELMTSIAGCSDYYLGSVTSYANSVKTGVLGVRKETIDRFGAVSEECVREMAEGIKWITGSDFSVATSGIAGPGGGTDEKPVGTVWIGIASPDRTIARKLMFYGDRKRNIVNFASNALNLLRLETARFLKVSHILSTN